MFQFPEFALPTLCIQVRMTIAGRVSPFRYLRIKAFCQLPVAFRRLTRLSSPVIAKASTTCTYSLDPITLSPEYRYPGILVFRIFFLHLHQAKRTWLCEGLCLTYISISYLDTIKNPHVI